MPGITIPIIPGIMPIQTYATFLRLTRLCGTHVPDSIHADLELIKVFFPVCVTFFGDLLTVTHLSQHDDQKVKDYGISLAVKMIRRLVDEGGLRGFHFCTLNLEKSVQSVLETLGWTPGHAKIQNRLIAVSLRDETWSPEINM
jgi:methylenetetrahydrofolate reductase (NADPH)